MFANRQTLLEYLKQANSSVNPPRDGKPSRSHNNEIWPIPCKVAGWKDFRWKTLRRIFENGVLNILNQSFDDLRAIGEGSPPIIYEEKDLNSVISKSIKKIVCQALEKTSYILLQQDVRMEPSSQADLLYHNPYISRPDWAGTTDLRQHPHTGKLCNILPGESKRSLVWRSEQMNDEFDPTSPDPYDAPAFRPLRQLAYYCVRACSRYGYIITERELVVVQVGSTLSLDLEEEETLECKAHVRDNLLAQYHSIPWENAGPDVDMTINLALLFLHLLAANNGRLRTHKYGRLSVEQRIDRLAQRQFVRQASPSDPVPNVSLLGSFEEDSDDTDQHSASDKSDTDDEIAWSNQPSFNAPYDWSISSSSITRPTRTATRRSRSARRRQQPTPGSSRGGAAASVTPPAQQMGRRLRSSGSSAPPIQPRTPTSNRRTQKAARRSKDKRTA